MELKLRDFESQVLYFNGMYKLPIASFPSVIDVCNDEVARRKLVAAQAQDVVVDRMNSFKHTLMEEIKEVDMIVQQIKIGFRIDDSGMIIEPRIPYTPIEFLTDLADWLGDIQVYCASEMAKFGLPLKEILSIIMSSNFSKHGADGQPIYDEHGKVQKGPGYWKPEPRIKALIEERIHEAIASITDPRPTGIIWNQGEQE